MSALDGFRSIWSRASATFGDGVPDDDWRFDQRGGLTALQDAVLSAEPGDSWRGSAAEDYAAANATQATRLGRLGDLDQLLAAEIARSASVVAAGRRDLDDVRRFVDDAAARVPDTAAGDRVLYPVISKGSSDIQDIITRSHADLSAIGARIRDLGGQYHALAEGA